jgi:adenine-specific DNA glycosylase
VRVAAVAYRGAIRHVFTHRDVTAELFRVEVDTSGPAAPDRRWVSPAALGTIGVSSFARKTIKMGLPRSIGRSET